jgi:hypothetical protein
MREDMIAYMDTVKRERLAREHKRAIDLRLKCLNEWRDSAILRGGHTRFVPLLVDLYHSSPDVRAALDTAVLSGDHKEHRMTPEMRRALSNFDYYCARWRRDIARKMIRCLPATPDGPVVDESKLAVIKENDQDGHECLRPTIEGTSPIEFATALFTTSCCPDQVFDFETLLAHRYAAHIMDGNSVWLSIPAV